MADSVAQVLGEELATLFGSGTYAGLTDAELLDRFRTGRDGDGDRAFEALVARHGPMVLGICRRVLDDPADAHDAFQAAFVVLARRAGSIRKSESLSSWLYGVAIRVAARARATAIRRKVRERRVLAAAEAVALAGDRAGASGDTTHESRDGAAIVHEEVVRLPEHYRAPIVLCYFEGLTHEQAAARLRWPVGTVRSRLARGRDRLRGRLTRRGVAVPATIGPLAGWLAAGAGPGSASAAALPLSVPVDPALARATVRLASEQAVAAGSYSAASLTLAEGVLKTMTLKKLTVAACLVVTLGAGTGTTALVLHGAAAQDPLVAGQSATRPAAGGGDAKTPAADPLVQRLLDSARQRVDAQRAYYEEGRITIDRFLDALAQLEKAELLAATDDASRLAARKRFVDRLTEVLKREQTELQIGRGTVADVAEASQRLDQAQIELNSVQGHFDDYDARAHELLDRARQRFDVCTAFYKEGRMTLDRYIESSQQLAEAELRCARTDFERIAARKHHLDRVKEIEEREQSAFKAGRATTADVAEVTARRLQAELGLHDALNAKSEPDMTLLLRRIAELERKVEKLEKERGGPGSP